MDSQPQYVPELCPVPDDSNLRILNARHNLSHNSPFFTSNVNQNVYNPTIKVGQPGSIRGYRPWNSEDSPGPVSYPPPPEHHSVHGQVYGHGYGHGHGKSYSEQRDREYGHPDKDSRQLNWYGDGVNRRCNPGDRMIATVLGLYDFVNFFMGKTG